MSTGLIILGICIAAILSLAFSTLTYSLRDFSRGRLESILRSAGKMRYFEMTIDHADDLIVVTAIGRLFSNILVLIGVLGLFHHTDMWLGWQYLSGVAVAGVITLFCSVALPHTLSQHAPESFIAPLLGPMHGLRAVLTPIVKLMKLTNALVERAASRSSEDESDQREEDFEQVIRSAVEEGEKEGVVDETERQMIESAIAFHDTQVGQIMTARPEIFSVDVKTTLEGIKAELQESGHSRIPVYEGSLDHVVGVVHARDLIEHVGKPLEQFDARRIMRPAFFVPESKLLGDLLKDFRLQKVHIAMVLDEYGGTSGLVTIEDILEELVGDISDEHEPHEPAMFVRLGERSAEVDARIYIGDLNRSMGMNLPEEAGYDTLGGFISTTMGRIPSSGTTFEHANVRYTILDAEPQKVNRVRIDLILESSTA